ncbi:glutathione S-transferase family protein [Luteimonas sp. SX5]|uniref:Glutathione S-transferase family protein n=1 Tax=Luteimonas galliterrae TaxID=2940486 RepID=A0ABT0MHV6_9GAMM|nr:glutathione S-transferase family protein [Luteimonas galliterrae]MCL1634445.1 glutathione S-transferase family protein [Luteimonas galliterrae]
MLTLVIGNKNYSSWSLRPWLLMRHFGVPFAEHALLLDTPSFYEEIERWSPNRSVPALHDDDLVIWDSLAICEYVNERFLEGRGWPSDPRARAQARSAAAEMHSGFVALRKQLPMNLRRQPDGYHWNADADRDIARVQAIWRGLRQAYGAGGPFLCGEFGIVDAMFAPVLVRFAGYGAPIDATAQAYGEAIRALPAYAEWHAAALAETVRLPDTDNLAAEPAK